MAKKPVSSSTVTPELATANQWTSRWRGAAASARYRFIRLAKGTSDADHATE